MRKSLAVLIVVGLVVHAGVASAADPVVSCHAGKLKIAGKYGGCLLSATSKGVKTASTPDYSRCESGFSVKWQKAETKAGTGICIVEGDAADIEARTTVYADTIATLLAGGTLVECGNGIADGIDECDGADLDGQSCATLGYALGGSLACSAGCGFDTSGCVAGLAPATGQTTSYGIGDDGDLELGATLAYADNADGTITDLNTGLMWEKKVQRDFASATCTNEVGSCANPHDADNSYAWSAAFVAYDGPVVTIFLEQLNNRCDQDTSIACTVLADCAVPGGECGFAGHRDWRLPNQKELHGIADFSKTTPAVATAFHGASCGLACSDITSPACSCDSAFYYWSSTTGAGNTSIAWVLDTSGGVSGQSGKQNASFVRAVRGGV